MRAHSATTAGAPAYRVYFISVNISPRHPRGWWLRGVPPRLFAVASYGYASSPVSRLTRERDRRGTRVKRDAGAGAPRPPRVPRSIARGRGPDTVGLLAIILVSLAPLHKLLGERPDVAQSGGDPGGPCVELAAGPARPNRTSRLPGRSRGPSFLMVVARCLRVCC